MAPEIATKHLLGYREIGAEHRVITSPIKTIEGNKITTMSGSIYILQDIDLGYEIWMKENNIKYDPANPIVDRRKS
jgi:hypothetical protein